MKSDPAILQDIRAGIEWRPFVDSDQVNVSVSGGIATLTGTVDTWHERSAAAAAENALEGGAIKVKNQLVVD